MQLDCLTFYKDRLECLDTKSVKSRSTVQHYRVLFDNLLQYIPYFRLESLDHFLGALNIVCGSVCCKLLHNERLEKLDCHLLRKTTLIDFQLWLYADNGTS